MPASVPGAAAVTLLLVRHGEAAPASRDEARELTTDGRRAIRMLSAELQSKALSPSAIRTSPLRRAHQTAEIIFSALPNPGPVLDTALLASGASVESLVKLLRGEKPGSVVVWVGHVPDLGAFAARLLGEPGEVPFKAGAAVLLEVDPSSDPPRATRRWTWTP